MGWIPRRLRASAPSCWTKSIRATRFDRRVPTTALKTSAGLTWEAKQAAFAWLVQNEKQ
jgi:hypothetical protein